MEYKGWRVEREPYPDGDGFYTIDLDAVNEEGRRVMLDVSRFRFQLTEERFRWFVDNDFPSRSYFDSIAPIDNSDMEKIGLLSKV